MAVTVIGRDEELGSVEAFVAAVGQGPRALVLSGEAGIGKTILWEAGVEKAGAVRARPFSPQRRGRGFALLRRALRSARSGLRRGGAGACAAAAAGARGRAVARRAGRGASDARAIGLALLDVLRALADDGPVVVALDDVQWLDASSAAVLQIALRRLHDEPVGLLATLRKAAGVAAPFELEVSFAEERLERIWLGPLSLGALHRLLKQRLGLELTRPELGRVLETSAGNPFFALELGRELVRTHERPAAGRALRVPASLRELLGGRLARLPAETIDVLFMRPRLPDRPSS